MGQPAFLLLFFSQLIQIMPTQHRWMLPYVQSIHFFLNILRFHTVCIWFWMAKDVGVASDGNFSSYLIGKSWYNHFRSYSMGGNRGLDWQGMANPTNQPIAEKLPKWHFLTHACNSKIFGAKLLLLKCFESATKRLYPKNISGSVQVLILELFV